MPKLMCRCGYVLNLSTTPANFEFALVPELRIENIAEKIDEHECLSSEVFFKIIDEVKTTVYCCPSCGRFHVDDGGGMFSSFVRELP